MKKLKEKFKRAIFAFFKEEILNAVEARPFPVREINISPLNLKKLETQIIFDDDFGMTPVPILYHQAVQKARHELFEESLKYIEVDANSVISEKFYPKRCIRVSMYVGNK